MKNYGYDMELLHEGQRTSRRRVCENVHNDTCYLPCAQSSAQLMDTIRIR